MQDKKGQSIECGDYVETFYSKTRWRWISNYRRFTQKRKYGQIEKICEKSAKVRYFENNSIAYMHSNELEKISRSEAMFRVLKIAKKI